MESLTLTRIIDDACRPLARRRLPATMRVHPEVFAHVRDLRAREIADGYPLMFLGMELAADGKLGRHEFKFDDDV